MEASGKGPQLALPPSTPIRDLVSGKSMPRLAPAAAWLLLCLTTPLIGQSAPAPPDSTDVLVLDEDFVTGGEIVRVFLYDKQVYRAELSSPDVTLEVRPRFSGSKPIRTYPILSSRTPSGASVVEIYPDQDAEYEIRPSSIQGARIGTRLRLYRDVSESRRRFAVSSKRGWEVGIELGGGWHSGFTQSNTAPIVESDPSGGTDIEGCLSARSRTRFPRLGMCVLGIRHQSQRGARSILWVYTEPRLGILWGRGKGYSSWESGALFRFGMGIIAETTTPKLFAPGVFLARHIRGSRDGASWTVQASYSRAFFKGFTKPTGFGQVTPKSHLVSLSVGWYR
jgi:hypothetical protein